jgi:site-specific DNA-methyltransferase (adenine-specific)
VATPTPREELNVGRTADKSGCEVAGTLSRESTDAQREVDGTWPEEWTVQSDPPITLAKIDCLEGLRTIDAGTVDVLVTSPPYNLGTQYSTYNDAGTREDYLSWMGRVSDEIKVRLSNDGSFFLNLGSSPTNPWGPFEVITRLRENFALQNVIHWVKSIYVENESYGRRTALNVGHYKPINSERFLNDTHEYIFHLTKSGSVPIRRLAIGVPYKDQGNVRRWKEGGGGVRCRGNTWYIPYRTIQSRANERPHPASFPSGIAEMCVKLHGLDKGKLLVVDPFMGIGNTAIACKELGTRCIGFEIDPEYHAASLRLLRGS